MIIVSFWLSTGPVDFALSWSQSSQSAQQNAMKYVHENNATVLISAGGSTETPYTTLTGNAYGLLVAKFAIDNNFDGNLAFCFFQIQGGSLARCGFRL